MSLQRTPSGRPSRILIAGVPRSGTTWVGEVLARAPAVTFVNEPDNHEVEPFAALWEMRDLGLTLTPESLAAIRGSDRAGSGFETTRVRTEVRDRWRRLTPHDLRRAVELLERIPATAGTTPPEAIGA